MVIPDYLIWTLDTKKALNGTTEYETMCTVSGISWGIVLGYAELRISIFNVESCEII